MLNPHSLDPRQSSITKQPSAGELLIRVRADDSLLWSFPVWLACRLHGIPTRLEAQGASPQTVPVDMVHLPPEVRLGTLSLTQLMAILETLHEQHPNAGIWPSELGARARARDACAGLLVLCGSNTLAPRRSDEVFVCIDPTLPHRLRTALDDERDGTVAAVATAALLLGVQGLFDQQSEQWVRTMRDSTAAISWLRQPQVQACFAWTNGFGGEWSRGMRVSSRDPACLR